MKREPYRTRQIKASGLGRGVCGSHNHEPDSSAWIKLENGRPEIRELRERVQRGIQSNRLAQQAFNDLELPSPELFEYLVGVAIERGKREHRRRGLSRSPTDRQLKYFPKRLESIADQIEKISPFCQMHQAELVCGVLNTKGPKIFPWWLFELPLAIRVYAKLLEEYFRCLGASTRANRRFRLQANNLFWLIDQIRRDTGKPAFERLTKILNAVSEYFGTSQTFDALSLKKLDLRRRKAAEQLRSHALTKERKENLIRLLTRAR
jgi:hypothetical protein